MEQTELFPDNVDESVELRLVGIFNPKEFADSVVAFVGLISGVSESVISHSGASDWAITVEQGSTLIRAEANPETQGSQQTVHQVASMIYDGLLQLDSSVNEDHHSDYIFDEKVLKHIRKIASLAIQRDAITISIKSDGRNILISPTIADHTSYLLGPKKAHTAIGHVEGQLSTLTGRRGFKMIVYRSLDNLAVECTTDDPDLQAQALKSFGQRVSVQGIVKYNNRGNPVRVIANEIRVFRPERELTPISEIKGTLNEHT
ncbi:MAG: hypothetical protein OXE59_07100 [Bacteroidetes bacterium]|nr:hypothetical protein [Bacteroidota bacterium]MCY4233488.1 hypothetical protein [Bacteroidota bacterium]